MDIAELLARGWTFGTGLAARGNPAQSWRLATHNGKKFGVVTALFFVAGSSRRKVGALRASCVDVQTQKTCVSTVTPSSTIHTTHRAQT